MNADDPRLANYARRLRWALSALPEADRDGIVAEMRSHVLDRMDAGATLADALAGLGEPEDYARGFRDAYALAYALSSRRTSNLIAALLQGAAYSALAACVGVLLLVLWAAAALVVYVAILKVSDPAHVGLWSGENFFFIGIIDDPSSGRELLGPWITPLALVCVTFAWVITHAVAVWTLKRLPRKA